MKRKGELTDTHFLDNLHTLELSLLFKLVAMELASKMQLLQGSNHSLLLLKNQSIGAVQSATLRRSRSADATSESSRLRIQLGIRDGVVCSAHNNSSSPLSTNQDGPAFSGNFHGSSVKENRRTSQLCQVLRSALEAQALTQRPTDTSRAHQDRSESELPLRNEVSYPHAVSISACLHASDDRSMELKEPNPLIQ